jgi:hypothetical protein
VTGLALVSRHAGRVRTLVAHEPPLLELLPDAEEQRRATDAIVDTFRTQGFGPAWHHFMANAGFDLPSPGPDAPAPPAPTDQQLAEAHRFFEHELRPTTRYSPDIPALAAGNVVVGIGENSGHLVTYRTSVALAELLGIKPVDFPGDHAGFLGAPVEFAGRLREVLAR